MRRLPLIIAVLLAALLVLSMVFVVHEGQTALKIRLGRVQGGAVEPGLHFKWPLIEEVRLFDARVLAWDGDPERIPVKDSKFIYVDTFARWRIADPERFYNAVQDEQGAQSRLDDILDGSVRDIVSTHHLLELVRTTDRPLESDRLGFSTASPAETTDAAGGAASAEAIAAAALDDGVPLENDPGVGGKRAEVRQRIFEISSGKLEELALGIVLVDLQIKRIDYTEQVRDEVYSRMVSQQERVAERYRAQGQGKRAEIAGGTAHERQRIESESYRTAQEIKGEAEAESTRVYAEAYGQDEEFYRFLKSLETYGAILGDDDTLILSTDSDLLRYLKRQ